MGQASKTRLKGYQIPDWWINQSALKRLHAFRPRSSYQNFWWCAWAVLRSFQAFRRGGIPRSKQQIPFHWRLRWPRKVEYWNHLPFAGLQNKIPIALLHAERKPRVLVNQQNVWVLRWVQKKVQCQDMEGVWTLLQRHPCMRCCRRQDSLYARRSQSRFERPWGD